MPRFSGLAWRRARWGYVFIAPWIIGFLAFTAFPMIATFIFYGWGLGFWGKAGPALDLLLAIGIFFVVQVPLSYWWLKRFELGPMEYLWRRLTYGHAPALRAKPLPSH